ncbi:transcriptional regulator [Desulfurococcaceae archaeon MEX13E-LK6-19]|nr:transcriptional regulator [Desulfurococcaceae archaeon MEX13E-LK6-19]
MLTLFDLGYRYLFPSMRRRLVEILHNELGLEQIEIAEKLEISQAAVSRYLSMKRGVLIDISRYKDVDAKLKKLAEEIAYENIDTYTIYKGLVSITIYFLAKGYACRYHARIDPSIDPSRCRICLEILSRLYEQ